MGANGSAYVRILRTEVFAWQEGLRSRESQTPQILNTLLIGVCGIVLSGGAPEDGKRFNPEGTEELRRKIWER